MFLYAAANPFLDRLYFSPTDFKMSRLTFRDISQVSVPTICPLESYSKHKRIKKTEAGAFDHPCFPPTVFQGQGCQSETFQSNCLQPRQVSSMFIRQYFWMQMDKQIRCSIFSSPAFPSNRFFKAKADIETIQSNGSQQMPTNCNISIKYAHLCVNEQRKQMQHLLIAHICLQQYLARIQICFVDTSR